MQNVQHKLIAAAALDTAVGTTVEINVEEATKGSIHIPTGSPITTLTFHAAPDAGGTYLPLQTQAGVAVTMTVAATKAYPLPPECFMGNKVIKIVVNAAGTAPINLMVVI